MEILKDIIAVATILAFVYVVLLWGFILEGLVG